MIAEKLNILADVEKGTPVFDLDGVKVGKVNYFQPPEESVNPSLTKFPYDLAHVNIPDPIIYRLLNSGFICLDSGWFAKDRLVTPDQVSEIKHEGIRLNVRKRDIVTL